MQDQNVVIFLDKIKKLVELGNKPKAVLEIESIISLLEINIRKKRGVVISPLLVSSIDGIADTKLFSKDNRAKINEIISFLNKRFAL